MLIVSSNQNTLPNFEKESVHLKCNHYHHPTPLAVTPFLTWMETCASNARGTENEAFPISLQAQSDGQVPGLLWEGVDGKKIMTSRAQRYFLLSKC